ncbi:MAG TPA: lysophospholipase [Candidatus Dormibacteraeota bacterium]|nr:lysophospholipase [Candidatus Dormibacteraeota bacterium]
MAADLGEREGILSSRDGTRLAWRAWPVAAPRAVLGVVHGLGEHAGRYARLAEAMASHGYTCYALDLRGMGGSDGRRGHVDRWGQWVEDVAAFHDMVTERSGDVEVVPLGHSFGGVVVASAVLDGAVRPRRFVLSNPAFRPAVVVPRWKLLLGRATSGLVPTLTLSNEVDAALLSRDPAVAAEYTADPLVHDRISSRLFTEWVAASERALARAGDLAIPCRLIVSEDDRIIDREGSLEFARRAGAQAKVVTYPGRYHEPFNDLDAGEVFADLAAWLG